MTKEHPEDNAQSRFTAFWMIVFSLLIFVGAISFILCFNASNEDAAANGVESRRASIRFDNLEDTNKAQQTLIAQAAVVDKTNNLVRIPVSAGMNLILPELRKQKAGPSKVVVPGSPTSLKQAQVKPVATDKKAPAKKQDAKKAAPTKAPAVNK